MDLCSVMQPLCSAVTYSGTNCSTFANGTDTSSTFADQTAVADAQQIQEPADLSCPYQNNSIQTTQSGEQFEILCGVGFPGWGDYTPYTIADMYGSASDSIASIHEVNPHADSLQECMEICSSVHPLCQAVEFNIDVTFSYGNCYLKNDPFAQQPFAPADYISHSAVVTPALLGDVNTTCPSSGYNSTNGAHFEVTCFDSRSGSQNFTSFHQNNVTGCMDRCATYTGQECVGVVFDMSMAAGFDNCTY